MSWGAVAVAGASLVGGLVTSNQQSKAAQGAANTQAGAAYAGIDEQRRQFDAIQELLKPYVEGGTSANLAQQDLLGLNGVGPQQEALASIQNGSQYKSLVQQGQNAILQNASATGGLRGGNVQGALAQYNQNALNALIDSQFSKLGPLSSLGQASAAGQAALGQQTGTNIASLLGQVGSAQAGGILGQGQANVNAINSALQGIGTVWGAGVGSNWGSAGSGVGDPYRFGYQRLAENQ